MKQKGTLSHQKILKLDKDHKQAAKAASLFYTSDSKPGITRQKKQRDILISLQGNH